MNSSASTLERPRSWPQSLPFYYGWVNVVCASVAMTATLPGRTHGLGLVTVKLLRDGDLNLDSVKFADINLAASLIGAAFCIPIGWLIDRFGVRVVLTCVTAALGLSVIGMASVTAAWSFLIALILVRGFGQSALSVVSVAVIGKWFQRRMGMAMGLFAVLLTFGFIGSVLAMGAAVEAWGWRSAWHNLGLIVLGLAPLFWIFVRSTPEGSGVPPDEAPVIERPVQIATRDYTFRQALATPAFWILALGSGAFNLVWSGVTLFNESILAERGFGPNVAVQIMAILTGVGLIANLAAGAFATRTRVVRLLGVGLALLAAALVALPTIDGLTGIRLYAAAIGLSGGVITVVFFAAWGHLYGRAQFGRIQGAAQFATVLASAIGPEVLSRGRHWTGDYSPTFYALACVVAMLSLAAFVTPLPRAIDES